MRLRGSSPTGCVRRFGQPVVVEKSRRASGQFRRRGGIRCGAGRLYPDGVAAGAAHRQCAALSQTQLRSSRVRAGRDHDDGPKHADGAPGFSGQDRAGVHRLCPGQPRQAELRLPGNRHDLAPDGRAVPAAHRNQAGACALQGHGARDQRPRRWSRRPDVHRDGVGASSCIAPARPASSPSPPRSACRSLRTSRP